MQSNTKNKGKWSLRVETPFKAEITLSIDRLDQKRGKVGSIWANVSSRFWRQTLLVLLIRARWHGGCTEERKSMLLRAKAGCERPFVNLYDWAGNDLERWLSRCA